MHTHTQTIVKNKNKKQTEGMVVFFVLFYVSFVPKMAQRFSEYAHTHTYSKWRGVAPVLRVIFFVFFRLVVLFILLRFIFTVHIAQVKLKLKLALNAPLFELAWVICISPLLFSLFFKSFSSLCLSQPFSFSRH